MSKALIQRRSLQAEIASRLREEIVEGVWEPGIRLQERLLCERYGVSRSPLREAYQVMAAEGLIELHPNRGAVVTRPTLTDAVENLEIIQSLETLAIGLACERASDKQLADIEKMHSDMRALSERGEMNRYFALNNEIHAAIVRASGNSALVATHESIMRHVTRLQNLSGAQESAPEPSMQEHELFVAALLNRNTEEARASLGKHLQSVASVIERRVAKESSPTAQ
ncbi:MAG: GntR family transcriptional regulator [Gammaproteobacteria bacterium]